MGVSGYQEIRGQDSGGSGYQEKAIAGFEKLWVWQRAHQLMLEVHIICRTLPPNERFLKRDQIERSSSSIPDNIAEGYTSYYYQDKIKGFYTARKELGETQNHLRALQGKHYITNARAVDLICRYEEVARGLNGLVSYVRRKRGDRK